MAAPDIYGMITAKSHTSDTNVLDYKPSSELHNKNITSHQIYMLLAITEQMILQQLLLMRKLL